MIGYYINCSTEVCSMFKPYVWNKVGFGDLLEKGLSKTYGKDMDLLLILYYVEGEFSSYVPVKPELGNYMKRTKDIKVSIGVPKRKFHNRNEFERREFIVDSTLNAIKLVKERLQKKKLDINFDKLINDAKEVAQEYLKYPKPYAKE